MRLPRLTKRKVITAIVVILISIVVQFISPQNKQSSQNNSLVKVARVIDGDTIELENKQKVRYIGIDTPELHDPRKPIQCFAQEAYERNKQLVEGKMVKLQKDISETDKYRRLLRYVFLYDPPSTSEAVFINKYLVTEGYAHAATFPPDVKYANVFVEEQRSASLNKKGLWNQCL